MSGLRDIYIVATHTSEPLAAEIIREAFGGDDVELTLGEAGCLFSVRAGDSRVDVKFEGRLTPLGWTPELLTGTPELREELKHATGFYKVAFEPGKPQGSVAVFEALWTVRTLLEIVDGLAVDTTAFKLHSPQDVEEITELDFDIRDHLTIHAQQLGEDGKTTWIHTHGLAKFASPEVELFNISEDDMPAAETFLHELCNDLAFGQGPAVRQVVSTSVGMGFILLPGDEARTNLFLDPEVFDGHLSGYVTVVSPEGRHSMSEILKHYRERFEEESDEEAEALQGTATRLLPLFKARFLRRGLMEPLNFVVRAPFEVHPEGEEGEVGEEQLWVEIVSWTEDGLIGRLVDGGQATTEWRKGAHVEIDESQINALAVTREGRTLEPEEMEALLQAERPA
ncbi:MAG: hypothetical protein AMXMBFR34_48930 [Myxococcaceae bacterium]